jgi:ABC-type transport system involved in multi-copper enzyme maturation permease subunit
MLKALVFKELRETVGIASLALLAYFLVIGRLVGYQTIPFNISQWQAIPFFNDGFTGWFYFISIGFSIALGLRQTIGESWRGTWLPLLHRPVDKRNLIAIKLAVGLGVYLLVSVVPILVYAAWAATPGTHASPFCWWMTFQSWAAWRIIAICYFGAFLTGLRPGRWFGTRLAPMAAVVLPAALVAFFSNVLHWWFLGWLILILICAFLVNMILYVLRTRDYS